MNLGERIKLKRTENNLTLEDVGKVVGTSRATIQRYENGIINNIPSDKIELLAKALKTTPAFLMGWEEKQNELEIVAKTDMSREYAYIPDPVAAGVPETIQGINELPTVSIPDRLLGKYAGNKNIIIMRVNGDSMNKIFPSNSLIGVLMNYNVSNLKDGDLVVFNHNYEYSVKHFYDLGEQIVFKPNSTNIKYTDLIFKKDENLNIIGKVVMYSVVLD